LLDQLFSEVIVPKAVFKEVTSSDKPEAQSLEYYLKNKVHQVNMRNFIYLDAYVDVGETEAMVLYKQKSADKLLIDDKMGKNIAKINGINVIGSLGILLSAKQAGLISEVKSRLYAISNSRIYLKTDLIKIVLELADERG